MTVRMLRYVLIGIVVVVAIAALSRSFPTLSEKVVGMEKSYSVDKEESVWRSSGSGMNTSNPFNLQREGDAALHKSTLRSNDADLTELAKLEHEVGTRERSHPAPLPSVAGRESEPIQAQRPFRMSDSVAETCARWAASSVTATDEMSVSGGESNSSCYRLQQFLLEMENEPRDYAWANDTELRLRKRVEADPSRCAIRTIECRTSACVFECASLTGPLDVLDPNFTKQVGLKYVDHVRGYETGSSGERVTVTLIAYRRR